MAFKKLQAAGGFYKLNRSLRVSLLSGIKKTGIHFYFCARLKSRIQFFDLPGGLFLIPDAHVD
ncbi:MAG: hypothetical protein HUU50_16000 [Candidatus Brocadiae bacterium]|nr:hypothetical protein [Candidatus Brocadiia bacterium]